ncbi:MAG: molybdopterin-guanine dinucleotide biosynthesis protein B [Thermoplasmatota archaeon]
MMKSPVYIGFYGFSNTGKTTLIIRIIKQLTMKGFKLASIKQTSHSYTIDSSETDTWKHAQAGATLICFDTAVETSFMIKQHLSFEKIQRIICCIDQFDVVLVEGAHDSEIQKIRMNDQIPIRDNTMFTFDGDINKVICFIEKQITKEGK